MPLILREPVLTPLSWSIDKKKFRVQISYCYIYFYHVLIVFKNRKWSESFLSCIQNDEHQTGSQNQASCWVGRDLLSSLVKPAAQSRINTGCKPDCFRFCPFRSWRSPRWRLHYIPTVISVFHLHPFGISPVSIYDSSLLFSHHAQNIEQSQNEEVLNILLRCKRNWTLCFSYPFTA